MVVALRGMMVLMRAGMVRMVAAALLALSLLLAYLFDRDLRRMVIDVSGRCIVIVQFVHQS